jgi:DNA-binding GntR family transcriptional regulator
MPPHTVAEKGGLAQDPDPGSRSDVFLDMPPLRLDRNQQVANQIYTWLRGAILDLSLKPGVVLSRVAITDHLRVSSTPVRDALQRLAEETLVEVYPQHATRVATIDLALAYQAHFLRRSVEIEIVRTLTRSLDERVVASLRNSLDRQRAFYGIADLASFTLEDQSFHQLMYEAAGVIDLWALVRSRSGHLDRLRRLHLPAPGKAAAVLRDHEAIVDAIVQKDSQTAVEALRVHLAGTLANAEEIRHRHPDLIRV